MTAIGVWHIRTTAGTFVLRRLLSGEYVLFIDNLALGTYPTATAGTESVYHGSTGYEPWDSRESRESPDDLDSWIPGEP